MAAATQAQRPGTAEKWNWALGGLALGVVVVVALVIIVRYRARVAHHYAYEARMVPIVPADTWGAYA